MHYPSICLFFGVRWEIRAVPDRSHSFLIEGFKSVQMTTAKSWGVGGKNLGVARGFARRKALDQYFDRVCRAENLWRSCPGFVADRLEQAVDKAARRCIGGLAVTRNNADG
jgi:hypothetical protein